MKIIFGEICKYALSDSWSWAVIKGEGEAVAESWPTIDEVGIHLRFSLNGIGARLSKGGGSQTCPSEGEQAKKVVPSH